MKKFEKISVAAIVASVAVFMSAGAFAADGSIHITGKVEDVACNIAIGGNAAGNTLGLPTVFKSALASGGAVSGATSFQFAMTGCPTTGAVRAHFDSANVDPATGNLINNATTPAANVQVQVVNASNAVIDLRDNTGNDFVTFDASGNATLDYSAQYIAVGAAAGGGDVDTQLVYTVEYQ